MNPVFLIARRDLGAYLFGLTGYVIVAAILLRPTWSLALYAALATERGIADPLFAFAVAMALFITWTHRANLQRMLAGNENRFEKVMLFRRRAGV